MSVHITKIIVARNATIGRGDKTDDPIRTVLQIYNMQGELVLEIDPWGKDEKPCLRTYNPGAAL